MFHATRRFQCCRSFCMNVPQCCVERILLVWLISACPRLRLNCTTCDITTWLSNLSLHLYLSLCTRPSLSAVVSCSLRPSSPSRPLSVDPRSPSFPSTNLRRRTTATCRWTAEWPIAAARRGFSCTSRDAIRWIGPTRCAGTHTSSPHTLTQPAAQGWSWLVAIRWSITFLWFTVKHLIDQLSSCRLSISFYWFGSRKEDSADASVSYVSWRSQLQMRRPARRTPRRPTAHSAGELNEWTATARSETARTRTTTRNTTLWRWTDTACVWMVWFVREENSTFMQHVSVSVQSSARMFPSRAPAAAPDVPVWGLRTRRALGTSQRPRTWCGKTSCTVPSAGPHAPQKQVRRTGEANVNRLEKYLSLTCVNTFCSCYTLTVWF